MQQLKPQNKVAYFNGDVAPREIIKKGLTGIDYHYNVFLKEHPEWLDEAKEVGCEVNVWTVDKPELLELFAADDRVDIITTNAPELLQEVVAKHPVSLSSRINSLLVESLLMKRSHFGAVVLDATTGFTLYQREPHKLHRPASTLKLFTCATAIRDLGLDHMISTQVRYTGEVMESPLKKRILKGDLYVIGGMNPILSEKEMSLLLDQCASLGVDSIAGHVIADLSMKNSARMGAGWCWDDKGDDSPQLSPLLFERDTTFMEAFVKGLHE
ncbi:MAG: D-alanyl-D-alanine carboxypeptidase, partial [Bacteroidaceae bacterium]|nr:D-alanyl-D-alanine carboxypeptidase [Bacteroidaceae bacterium]